MNLCVCTKFVQYPFCRDKYISSAKNTCFAIWVHVDTKSLNLSHHVLFIGEGLCGRLMKNWGLTFSCGANLWRSSASNKYSAKIRSSPLDYIFDTCASTSSSHCFSVGEAEHMCFYPFARTSVSSVKKRVFCNLDARWPKILVFVPSCPTYGWLAWWCDFFRAGPTFEDHPQVFSQKKVQPLGLYFWHLRLDLFKSMFQCWWSWTSLFVPICKNKCNFSKKTHVLQFGCAVTHFFEFVPDVWLMQIQHYKIYSRYIFISKVKILVPNCVKSCTEPYPLKQSWVIFFLGFDVDVCSSEITPHGNYFPVAGHLYTKGK